MLMEKTTIQLLDSYIKEHGLDYSGEYEDEGKDGWRYFVDYVSYQLTYKDGQYDLSMSVYHASEDNNANNPECHTDEYDESFDDLEDIADDYPNLIEDIYKCLASKL